MSDACKAWLKFKQRMSEIIEYILGLLEYVAVNRTILQQMLCRRAVWGGVYNKEEAPMLVGASSFFMPYALRF